MSLHYLGKHEPQKLSFQSCCILCLEHDMARNKICTLYLIIRPYWLQKKYQNWLMNVKDIASQSSVVYETQYIDDWKDNFWHRLLISYGREWLRYWLLKLDLYSRHTCGSTCMPARLKEVLVRCTTPYWYTLCIWRSYCISEWWNACCLPV